MPRYRTMIEFDAKDDDEAKSHIEVINFRREEAGDNALFRIVDGELMREATWWEKVK